MVAAGTYTFNPSNTAVGEPQLSVSYLGPTSSSGHGDFPGGGDSMVTFGEWGADDPIKADGTLNCQPDPSKSLMSFPAYCANEVGTTLQQASTLMHELGHTLTLAHGGTYYTDQNNPSVASYDLNCKPNYLSVMSYLFQTRGFLLLAASFNQRSIILERRWILCLKQRWLSQPVSVRLLR